LVTFPRAVAYERATFSHRRIRYALGFAVLVKRFVTQQNRGYLVESRPQLPLAFQRLTERVRKSEDVALYRSVATMAD